MDETGARWAVILAGGDGVRLRSLTRELTGDDRPKQFCPVLGRDTLLDQTRRRVARAVSPFRTLLVVTRHHERFYAPVAAALPPHCVVAQPENRGTAPAILYALLRVAALAPAATVAIFPSDHYISDDGVFMAHVEDGFDAVTARPDLVVLLGITPDRPEVEYGWIEPDVPVAGLGELSGALSSVNRFWEKPSAALAETLRARGSLWNSFVMVGRVGTFLGLIGDAVPGLATPFAAVREDIGTPREADAVRALYAGLPATDFSRQVLAARPAQLAVLPVAGVGWNDLGDPRRVRASRVAEARSRSARVGALAVAHG